MESFYKPDLCDRFPIIAHILVADLHTHPCFPLLLVRFTHFEIQDVKYLSC